MNKNADFYINLLELEPHPEGGYFKEVYRSSEKIKQESLPARFNGDRNISTSIYFLLERNDTSSFHKIASDELWHFYDGCTVKIYIIENEEKVTTILLGRNIESGEQLQCIIPAGKLFGAELSDKNSFALVGCTVAPGFDFNDFEMPEKAALIKQFPVHGAIIEKINKK